MINRIGRFQEKVMSHNMNICYVLKTNGVQSDRVYCRGASLLRIWICFATIMFSMHPMLEIVF